MSECAAGVFTNKVTKIEWIASSEMLSFIFDAV